jgi:RNA polymerase sigma-70 factor (ECF subfamily)
MNTTEENDEILIGRYARGDAQAFDQLYRRHELRVWRYLERSVGDQATSDELLQEVWLGLARNAVSLESVTRFRTRLFTLAYDRMVTSRRERTAKGIPAPSRATKADEAGNTLSKAMGQLSGEERDAYLLHLEGQLSVGEIAEITESSIDTVDSRIRMARLKLHEIFSEKS